MEKLAITNSQEVSTAKLIKLYIDKSNVSVFLSFAKAIGSGSDAFCSGAGDRDRQGFFLASRPLKAAKGDTRTWQPLWGRLMRCRQSQQCPFPGHSKAAPRECERPGAWQWGRANRAWYIRRAGSRSWWGCLHSSLLRQDKQGGPLDTLLQWSLPSVLVTCLQGTWSWYQPGR